MTAILGISAFYHDSAAALVVDGKIVAAAQENVSPRKKHDPGFPFHAVEYCLKSAALSPEQIDYVGFYDKPLLKFERLLETYLSFAPLGFRSFVKSIPIWIKQKLYLPREISRGLKNAYHKRYVFAEHHESHAASAFFPSPFDEAAILTVDGVGEWATASFGIGRRNQLRLTHEMRFPHSLGLLYSAFTFFTGFRVNSGEYKLMGLAPYGVPKYVDLILNHLIDLKDDGSFQMDMTYFNYCHGLTMTGPKFDRLFGGPPRQPEERLTDRELDIAASIQKVTEEILLRMVRHVHAQTGMKRLCMAGGVALNCVANGRIVRKGPFEELWIQPAAGDAGGARRGPSDLVSIAGKPSRTESRRFKSGSCLGPEFSNKEIREFLDREGGCYRFFADDAQLCETVAELISHEKVIGWFHGRMEFGPRSLGSRSIIGDARSPQMQSTMNLKIKFRESFRPFAPSILADQVDEYFETLPGQKSPYMLLVAPLQKSKRIEPVSLAAAETGLNQQKIKRSIVPAITHVDYSARIQTVDAERHGRFHQLLQTFAEKTGSPLIINTSFNVRGEPIVCTPEQAYRCFMATDIDALVLENFVLLKEEQHQPGKLDNSRYLAEFALD